MFKVDIKDTRIRQVKNNVVRRLRKFDAGLYFCLKGARRAAYIWGAYILDGYWVTYLGDVYTGGRINRILWYF